jgi:hypothetical protein
MASLQQDYAHRRDNPLYHYFVRENCRPRQVFILASVCVFFSVTCGVLKYKFASTPGTVLGYVAFRWFLGEFLWCWLAADHAFSTIKHAREAGHWRDWCMTPLKAPQIASAFILSTSRALGIAVMATSVVEALIPFHPAIAGADGSQLCRVALLLALWFGHGATIPLAVSAMAHAAIRHRIDGVNWAKALGKLLSWVGLVAVVAAVIGRYIMKAVAFILLSPVADVPSSSPIVFVSILVSATGSFALCVVLLKRRLAKSSYDSALRYATTDEPET